MVISEIFRLKKFTVSVYRNPDATDDFNHHENSEVPIPPAPRLALFSKTKKWHLAPSFFKC